MPPPGQNPTAVWDGRSLLAGLEVSLKSWAGLPVTVAVVVVVGGLWCGQIACSATAHALQPTRATFAFDDLPLLVGGGAGVHGHEEEARRCGPRPLPLLCPGGLVGVLVGTCSTLATRWTVPMGLLAFNGPEAAAKAAAAAADALVVAPWLLLRVFAFFFVVVSVVSCWVALLPSFGWFCLLLLAGWL